MPLVLGRLGSSDCCCGPCRGFPAFDGSGAFYKYLTYYDVDCCTFGPCRASDFTDGRVKFKSNGCWYGEVVESTGNYGNSSTADGCIDCCSIYPVGSIWDMANFFRNAVRYLRNGNYFAPSPGQASKRFLTFIKDAACCNGDGSRIYAELTEEINLSSNSECSQIGACCGPRQGGVIGGYYSATTCNMLHECECDTAAGAIWHGAGSTCEHNPCCCEGFRAFDGSSKWYRYAKYINEDSCSEAGYFVVKWTGGTSYAITATCANQGAVIEASGSLAEAYGLEGLDVPASHTNNASANSATFSSTSINADCGNASGSKSGWLLYNEISCALNPLP